MKDLLLKYLLKVDWFPEWKTNIGAALALILTAVAAFTGWVDLEQYAQGMTVIGTYFGYTLGMKVARKVAANSGG